MIFPIRGINTTGAAGEVTIRQRTGARMEAERQQTMIISIITGIDTIRNIQSIGMGIQVEIRK